MTQLMTQIFLFFFFYKLCFDSFDYDSVTSKNQPLLHILFQLHLESRTDPLVA